MEPKKLEPGKSGENFAPPLHEPRLFPRNKIGLRANYVRRWTTVILAGATDALRWKTFIRSVAPETLLEVSIVQRE